MPKAATLALMMTLVLFLALSITRTHPSPTSPTSLRVVIDPGHGGHDPGAMVGNVQEKDLVLAIALRLAALARAHPHLEVILTRDSDRFVALEDRLALTHRAGAALYVSIHANSFPQADRCGVETLVDSARPLGDPSFRLAEEIQREVARTTGAKDLGVRRQSLYLRGAKVPAVLVEVGHLSCPAERTRLISQGYQERIAQGILQGILTFLGPS